MQHRIAISPLLQSHMLEFANGQPFGRAMGLLHTALPAVNMSSSQSQRLTQYIGNLPASEELLTSPGFSFAPPKDTQGEEAVSEDVLCETRQDACTTAACEESVSEDVLYVEVDGGHLRTDEGYRETKVGRIFGGHHFIKKSSDNEKVGLRMQLEKSDYLAQLGSHSEFTARFDKLICAHLHQTPAARMVAISDGAEWIGKWLTDRYPKAVVILDFYHALEHLSNFAQLVLEVKAERSKWIEVQQKKLLKGQTEQVIAAIKRNSKGCGKNANEHANQLIAYYEKNQYRMKYNEYRAAGYCIGSGAIESAISTVVQQRCKLVGQRWTNRVTAVLNIRAILKSGKREKLRAIISQQMGAPKAA
jgi:hypothetical protein